MVLEALALMLGYIYFPGISKDRQTEYCETNSSPKFGYFEVVTYA